ncbi:MAG: SWF/SNF helicase family protein, partial [Chloroflexi bacterium]|nr:SWF/SNF helicase family protein [Chloroflexota bacterium]
DLEVEDTHCYYAAGVLVSNCHQYKAKDSDQGWAFGLLAKTIPAVITLTGTFFGGPASSILWLLHRTQRDVRDDFGFSDEKRWVRRFGVLETTFKVEDNEHGAHSGLRRRRVSTKEKPGISPGIVRYTLPTTIFASIKDLGIKLPSFTEEFVTFEPTVEMERDLSRVWNFTWDEMKEWWPHYTSAWLQWNLARPNSCFRFEEVHGYTGNKTLECPPVVNEGELLPKEEWLAHMVKTELASGRKVIVYLRQTGTRDIRSRLVDVLTQVGIPGVVVLKSSIPPRRREQWLQDHPANVLITNPKLVETGLDLVQYSTGVFYEVEYSLYTLWQACRRIWRLGQTRPVKMFYLSYESTLEEKAYTLAGQKIKASQLLYGDEVASALVEDPGDASLVMALLKAIDAGDDLKLDHDSGLFADTENVVSNSVVGNPTIPSLSVFEKWALAQGLSYQAAVRSVWRRQHKPVSDAQMSLF